MSRDGLLNAYLSFLSCLLRLPVIIEACQWVPEIPGTSKVACWIYQKVTFRFSAGAIVISRSIQEKILALRVHQTRVYPMYRRPVLDRPERVPRRHSRASSRPALGVAGG